MPNDVNIAKLKGTLTKFMTDINFSDTYGKHEDKLVTLSFKVLRAMAHRDILVGGIIKKRCDQMRPFIRQTFSAGAVGRDVRGYRIINSKTNEVDDKAKKYMDFFQNTGFGYDVDREDDLLDVTDMLIRDTLIIDQIAIELRRDKKGDVYDFWVLDGATIKRNRDKSEKHKYAQTIEDPIFKIPNQQIARFTDEDLIFDYMNKRSDIKYRGFGYSALEQAVDVVTTFLFGMAYNRDQFVRDRIPRGFISVMGDVNPSTIVTIQNYWYQQMSGYGAKWKIPIIPSGKEGIGMDFKKIQDTNKDMQYHKLMQLIMALKATVFGIDLEELGIKTDDTKTIVGDSGERRLQYSKDSGLGSLLVFIEGIYNKILRKIDVDYRFEFVGLKDDDKDKAMEVRKKEIESYRTINEVREEEGLDSIDEDYAKVVLNPQAVSIYNAGKSQQAMGGMMGGGGDEIGDEEEPGIGGEDDMSDGISEEDTEDEDSESGNNEDKDKDKTAKTIQSAGGKEENEKIGKSALLKSKKRRIVVI